MKIWLVAGAFSGVGKTTLVQNLAKVLPCAEFLKIGHGKKKAVGTPNYFTSIADGLGFIETLNRRCKHCIVESNLRAGVLEPDIIIFLDRDGENRRNDADEFRTAAGIVIGQGANAGKWRDEIGGLKLSSRIEAKVLNLFQAQHKFLT
ncbi:MAG: hypothetical protein ABIC40_00090, partial [bacterium]